MEGAIGGPCLQPEQNASLASIAGYDDVVRELDRIEQNSRGLVGVASAGQSGEGRELFYATLGSGDTVFWIQGLIHADPAPGATEPFAQPEPVAWWHLYAETLPNYALDYHHP